MGLGFRIISIFACILLASCGSTPQRDVSSIQAAEPTSKIKEDSHIPFQKFGRAKQCCESRGYNAVVTSGGELSSKAGLEILKAGGNVVDAAVATAFALGVETPGSTGIGGGGFATLHLKKTTKLNHFVDFRETAPGKIHRNIYLGKNGKAIPRLSLDGALSVGTPGFVKGFYEVHKKWGKLPWRRVLQPAIKLAEKGFKVPVGVAGNLEKRKAMLISQPYARKIYFDKQGNILSTGDLLVQKDLGKTLRQIASKGPKGFYQGSVAKKIAQFVKQKGGILTAEDLRKYKVAFRTPFAGKFKNYSFISAPPPSAGGIQLAQALQVLEGFDLASEKEDPVDYMHLLAEVMAKSFADRALLIGDPDHVTTPYLSMVTKNYTDKVREVLSTAEHRPFAKVHGGDPESMNKTHTTHLTVMDKEGNTIAATITLNYYFGSGLVVPGTGIILNNELDDFTTAQWHRSPQGQSYGEPNFVAPYKRPVSSMSPTIVFSKGEPILALGAAGGKRIVTGVLQTMINYLEIYPGQLRASIFAPRMHHQWNPDKLWVEENGYPSATLSELKDRSHRVDTFAMHSSVNGIARNLKTGLMVGVFDPRDDGGAEAK